MTGTITLTASAAAVYICAAMFVGFLIGVQHERSRARSTRNAARRVAGYIDRGRR